MRPHPGAKPALSDPTCSWLCWGPRARQHGRQRLQPTTLPLRQSPGRRGEEACRAPVLMAHSEGRSPRQGFRGAPSGPGGPRARSAGVAHPGAASGPARSAAAAPRSRCLGSLLSATWVLPSHRLCARGQRGSASRPECKWGLLEGEAPATGWWSPTSGHVSLRPDKPPTVGPKEGSAPEHPLPHSWRDQSTLPLG